MASGGRVHPSDDMGGRPVFGVGGPSISRMSGSEMFQGSSSKSMTLEQAHWTDRRRKIGLARRTKAVEKVTEENDYDKRKEEVVKFVRENFHQKECKLFVPVQGQVGNGKKKKAKFLKCHCGEILSNHSGMRSRNSANPLISCFLVPPELAPFLQNPDRVLTEELPKTSAVWKEEECIQSSPSNAFGKITFNVEQVGGKKPAKYVRISKDDSVDDVLELMEMHWRIMDPQPPNLVISVVGGAKNFKLDGRMRETFASGLIKAAKTTSAWLITSGFNMGVQKAVGQAVHEGQTFRWDNDKMTHVLRCIGIAPWGYVQGRHVLESHSGTGRWNAYYRTSSQILHKQAVPLNSDHTHFIFVDDGHRIRYGGVAEFRSKFENKISSSRESGGLGIPVVLLLVEGGTDAIMDVSASLKQDIPVVICAGTGRAADILTYAYNHTTTTHNKERVISDYHRDKLARKIYAAYKSYMKPGREKEELEKWIDIVIDCCKREDLIIIFNINKHEELDLAILSVLLKGKGKSDKEQQLKLAMTWNRADIAQEEILREDIQWQEGSLEEVLTQALVENKVEFVKLLLMNGIIMKEYLTTVKLEHLYNSMSEHSHLYQILKSFVKKEKFSVLDITNFLKSVLDRYDDFATSQAKKKKLPSSAKLKSLSSKTKLTDLDTDAEEDITQFRKPYKQLMIWAVLMNRFQLAQLFWELGEEPITSALIATRLCHVMEEKVPKYLTIIRQSFQEMKKSFENLAVSVLDECHSTDPSKAMMLVERKSPTWSKLTCLQIAVAAHDQTFVSSVACQNSISNVWKSGMMCGWMTVMFSVICPLLILTRVEFTTIGNTSLSKLQTVFSFYTAPLTKFTMFAFSYIGFLLLFTYMLLVDFEPSTSTTEWILLVWVFSYLVGGIQSFLRFPSPTIYGRFRDFFDVMDRIDMLNQVLFFCAFIVRWTYPYEAKVVYCINAIIFYFRLMKLYTANRTLGPKMYMIKRMFLELAYFLMVLMVFLVAYGVASQGLLYYHRERSWLILKDIIYLPYWQIYGEIYLEDIETDDECTKTLTASLNGTLPNDLNTCRTQHWLVPFLLGAYLLAGNVLLINLLIAIFSRVFDQVEKNAIEIWKFQTYFLVMEFQRRPLLFPPLSLISDLFYAGKWVYMKVGCTKRVKSEQFQQHHLEFLAVFEKEMMANKLRADKSQIMNSAEMKLRVLQTRLDELTRVIEDELIAEQYNMMPSLAMENTMFAELGLKNIEIAQPDEGKTTETDIALTTDEEKTGRKKHKKKRKSKNKSKPDMDERSIEAMPAIHEETKELNILSPDEIPKPSMHKVISDEENISPTRDPNEPAPLFTMSSPTPPPVFLHESSAPFTQYPSTSSAETSRLRRRDIRRQGPPPQQLRTRGQESHSDPKSPILNVPHAFNFQGTIPATSDIESDEEPIPLAIYSPRASNLSVGTFAGHAAVAAQDSDSDVDSEVSVPIVPPVRVMRRHRSRRGSSDSLQTRLERAKSYNDYSSKLL